MRKTLLVLLSIGLLFIGCKNDITLDEFNVLYDGNENTSGEAPVDSTQYHSGDKAAVLSKGSLSRDAFYFTGWNTKQDGSGTEYAPDETFKIGDSDISLYAQWSPVPVYSIFYDGNEYTGGTVPVDDIQYPQGTEVTVLSEGTLTRDGYSFDGWNTDSGGTGDLYLPDSTFIMDETDVILYAQWSLIPTYCIEYDGTEYTDGVVPSDPTLYPAGAEVTVQPADGMFRTGYSFTVWNTQVGGGGTDYSPSEKLSMPEGGEILYAQWALNPTYTVTYDGNGNTSGDIPVDSNSYEENAEVTAALNSGGLAKTDYIFSGWSTEPDGGGTRYEEDSTFSMGSTNINLYAVWALPVADVFTGTNHTFILRQDGTLWGTGQNSSGQLGDGTKSSRNFPVLIMNDVADASADYTHSLIRKTDNTLWATGNNSRGQLGLGNSGAAVTTPVQAATNVIAHDCGLAHSIILKDDGTAWTMGYNMFGQIGDGTQVDVTTPFNVASDAASVSVGWGHSLILKSDGTLYGTGHDGWLQFGLGHEYGGLNQLSPIVVETGIIKAFADGCHSYIIKSDGSLWAAGNNVGGQLGLGESEFELAEIFTHIADNIQSAVSGFEYSNENQHSLFLKDDGSLLAAGGNTYGQLGDGSTETAYSPVLIMNDVQSIATGHCYSMIVKTDGSLWAVGKNNYGQLGDGTNTDRAEPVRIIF